MVPGAERIRDGLPAAAYEQVPFIDEYGRVVGGGDVRVEGGGEQGRHRGVLFVRAGGRSRVAVQHDEVGD